MPDRRAPALTQWLLRRSGICGTISNRTERTLQRLSSASSSTRSTSFKTVCIPPR
jgi:hypothetical protein